MLQLHPVLPRDYLRLGFEQVDAWRGFFWLEDCAALEDDEPRGLLSLLDDPDCPGLDAMVQAVNPRARCRPVEAGERGAGRRTWEIVVDDAAEPIAEPSEAAFIARSTVSGVDLERSRQG